MKILSKMRKHYPQELDEYLQLFGEEYWQDQIAKYCPLLENEGIDITDINWTKRKHSHWSHHQHGRKLSKIEQLYLDKYYRQVDPDNPMNNRNIHGLHFD